MKDEDYVEEMLKVGDCGDVAQFELKLLRAFNCDPFGEYLELLEEREREEREEREAWTKLRKHIVDKFSNCCPEGALIDNPEIIDQIKEMDVIPTYGGSK